MITRTMRIRGKFWVFCHYKGGGKQLSIFHHSLQFCHGEKKVCTVSGPAVEDDMSLSRSYEFFIEGDADVWFVLTETDK